MGEEAKQIFHGVNWKKVVEIGGGKDNETLCDSISIESSFEDSENSISSSISSSSDLAEDASSPTSTSTSTSTASSSSSLSSNGPLYGLHEIMAELPIKRGLSKHYQGKSQSFTSLAIVKSLEDLPKKVVPFRSKMKSCKSYGWGLDVHNKSSFSPKATISKKGSRNFFMSSLGKGSISALVITE